MEYRPRLEKGALSKNAGLLMQLAPPLALLQPSQTVTVPKQRVLLGLHLVAECGRFRMAKSSGARTSQVQMIPFSCLDLRFNAWF